MTNVVLKTDICVLLNCRFDSGNFLETIGRMTNDFISEDIPITAEEDVFTDKMKKVAQGFQNLAKIADTKAAIYKAKMVEYENKVAKKKEEDLERKKELERAQAAIAEMQKQIEKLSNAQVEKVELGENVKITRPGKLPISADGEELFEEAKSQDNYGTPNATQEENPDE